MKEADRIAQLEAKVRHLTHELADMISREKERDKMINELYGEVIQPSIEDDDWFSIQGLPEEMKDYATKTLVSLRRGEE